jgi:hypothetical protein
LKKLSQKKPSSGEVGNTPKEGQHLMVDTLIWTARHSTMSWMSAPRAGTPAFSESPDLDWPALERMHPC